MQCPECGDTEGVRYVGVNWNGEEYTDVGIYCDVCGLEDY